MNNENQATQTSATQNSATQNPAAPNPAILNPAVQAPAPQEPAEQNPATQEAPRENSTRHWSKEEAVAAIRACAAKLGRAPTMKQLKEETGVNEKVVYRRFGNYAKALSACGLVGRGAGFTLSTRPLFEQWAAIVREMGAIPTESEYEAHSRRNGNPIRKRFGYWTEVPAGMVQYAVANGLEEQWADVLEMAKRYRPEERKRRQAAYRSPSLCSAPQVLKDRPLYGAPLNIPGMSFAPVNEMGVVFLFGLMANSLGFIVTWIGSEFPDCEVFREVEPGRWQRTLAEFEFLSRNFLAHGHNPEECDLIVCWEHNWKECPLQVLELKKFFTFQQVKTETTAAGVYGPQAHSAISLQPGWCLNPFSYLAPGVRQAGASPLSENREYKTKVKQVSNLSSGASGLYRKGRKEREEVG